MNNDINEVVTRAKQMNIDVEDLTFHITNGGYYDTYRCAFNNNDSPVNRKIAKMDRGMSKINNLLARSKV